MNIHEGKERVNLKSSSQVYNGPVKKKNQHKLRLFSHPSV